jgi:hypothetical protein
MNNYISCHRSYLVLSTAVSFFRFFGDDESSARSMSVFEELTSVRVRGLSKSSGLRITKYFN